MTTPESQKDETMEHALARHRIKPEWHRRGQALAYRILDVDWQDKDDRRATLVTGVACDIRDAVEAVRLAAIEECAKVLEDWMRTDTLERCCDLAQDVALTQCADLIRALAPQPDVPICTWRSDEEGNWATSCGNLYILIEGTPADNSMAHCCYCGAKLEQELYSYDDGEQPDVPEPLKLKP